MPFGAAAATAVGAGASLVSGATNAIVGNNLNKKNRQFYQQMTEYQNNFNAQQAQIAYDRQRELYDYQFQKEAAYNDPSAQMQRMRAAGLNPALIYGSGVGDAGAVSAAPSGVGSASAASANPPQLQNYATPAIESMAQIASVLSNVDLNRATKEKTQADTDLSRANTVKATKDAETLAYHLEKMLPVEHKQLIQNLKRSIQDMRDSHQISVAQLEVFRQSANEIMSKVRLNEHADEKLQAELQGFQEYINNVYEREKYRHDMDKSDWEWLEFSKGLKNKIMKQLQDPSSDGESLIQNGIMYLLMKIMNM